MAEKYIDATLSTGDNDGSTKPNAWQSLQEAIDDATGGAITSADTVLCRHTQSPDETLTADITVDGNWTGSSSTTSPVLIGVNSSWVEDGTKYEIDGDDTVTDCISFNSSVVDYTIWKHFSVTKATAKGINVNSGSAGGHVFIDCVAHNNGAIGFDCDNNTYGRMIGCLAYSNGAEGFKLGTSNFIAFCCSRDNTEEGFYAGKTLILFYNCLAFGNTKFGFYLDARNVVINCVSDNNTLDNILLSDYQCILLGNRITNSGAGEYGLDANSYNVYTGLNYYDNNDGGDILDGENDKNYCFNLINSVDTNQYDTPDDDEGYESLTPGEEDYRLDFEATGFSQAIQIPTGQ